MTGKMASKLLSRVGVSVRRFATSAVEGDFKRKLLEEEAHAGSMNFVFLNFFF